MKIWKYTVLFYTGGAAYLSLELLFRGRSDPSMFCAGGLCFLLIGQLGEVQPRLSLPLRAVAGSAIVTMVELAAGMMVNRSYTVWDYRAVPLNFMGQICPRFSLLWIPVSLAAIFLYNGMTKQIARNTN